VEKEDRHGQRQHQVPKFVLEAHRARNPDGESGSVQEISLQVEERFEQIRDGVGRVGVIAVQGHDDVTGRLAETFLVAPAIAANLLADHLGAKRGGHLGGAIGGSVVDDDDFRQGMMTVIFWSLYKILL